MEPVFIDLHIHTSENPDVLNDSYDVKLLKEKIEDFSNNSQYLIALTDHNTVNKSAYLKATEIFPNILLGTELHVRNYDEQKPYHCHMYFNIEEINETTIDSINLILDNLYPKKVIEANDTSIPRLEEIMKKFDAFDFVLLPHGGQSHSEFRKSIPNGVQFDNTLERSIYYNHFDGFTARSDKRLGKTQDYFKRLGINDFVNLVTSSDNYSPAKYPCAKANNASPFVPTWMLASPTFNGLRLSLSESSRLKYGKKPDTWAECIQKVTLKNDNIDINVQFLPGLNVVIGGSSSGKTLLVDSIYRRIVNTLEDSEYLNTPYNIQDIKVYNPAGQTPHYLPQNYIIKICDQKDKDNTIDDIDILRNVFPSDTDEKLLISNGLSKLKSLLSQLIQSVKEIETLQKQLSRIPIISRLIVTDVIKGNPLRNILPSDQTIEQFKYTKAAFTQDINNLESIESFLENNPLISHDNTLVLRLKSELGLAYERSELELSIRKIIENYKNEIDEAQEAEDQEISTKRQQFESLLDYIKKYIRHNKKFYESLRSISKFSIQIRTKEIESMGHKLYIDNEFELTKEKFLEVVNGYLKPEFAIKSYKDIIPECFFESKFRKQKPKVHDYSDFELKIDSKFSGMNKKKYRITTKEGKNFDKLSAGWKTSVILDLILGWENDIAPLIIDQPEDNLATGYINKGLLKAIKKCKSKKQIILVSHNATIPMLGDAQNIIMCKNDEKFISIKSNPLEGKIFGEEVVDLIAETTDGGKISVKKRVKKYNLKKFRGINESQICKE